MNKKKQITSRLFSLLLTFVMVFVMLPLSLWQAEPAEATSRVGKFSEGHALKEYATGTPYKYKGHELTSYFEIYYVDYDKQDLRVFSSVAEGWTGDPDENRIREYLVNGKTAYCFEHGVMTNTVVELSEEDIKDTMIEKIYESAGKKYALDNMNLSLYYGYQDGFSISDLISSPENGGLGFGQSKYFGQNAKNYGRDDWYIATRQLVHESQQLMRDETFSRISNGLEYTHGYKGKGTGKKISTSHYINPISGTAAMDIYNFMASLIKDHLKAVNERVASESAKSPKKIALKKTEEQKDGKTRWESALIPVSEAQANDLRVAKKSGESYKDIQLKLVEKDGKKYQQYVYYTNDTPNTKDTFRVKRITFGKNKDVGNLLIWEAKTKDGHVQPFATGAYDPKQWYVQFTTEELPDEPPTGKEKPHPEYFPTLTFDVEKEDLNPGWDGDKHTPMGDATLGATYTLYRSINGGAEEVVDTVTLDENGTMQTLSDQPFTSADQLEQPPYQIDSGSYTHTETNPDGFSSTHCTVTPTKTEWKYDLVYRIAETRPDGRYVRPDKYLGERTYAFHYYGVTENSQRCTDDPENWSDIVYTCSASTTMGDGQATYDLNGLYPAISDQDVLAYDKETFVNDCYRGQITLTKFLEDEDVFAESNSGAVGGLMHSVSSKWRIYLNSGGYEGHKYVSFTDNGEIEGGTRKYTAVRDTSGTDNETTYLELGSSGKLLVVDLPYGKYTCEEVSADDTSFVLERFQIDIGEHKECPDDTPGGASLEQKYTAGDDNDNRYDYDLTNRKITNKIKVIKTNAETGKQVSAAGTKFYVRYMGNQLYGDPTKSDNYFRLLPNAQSITADGPYTFEADENGEITIPYLLEFGTYRLEEWLLPEGYFVGEYDEKGNGTSHDYGTIEEGQRKALAGSQYGDLVTIYDSRGNKVKYKDKDSYELTEVFNYYTFKVEKQEPHIDGNFGQLVDCHNTKEQGPSGRPVYPAAGPTYDPAAYPYIVYYRSAAMPNNMVKGKIEIKKTGDVLTGFKQVIKNGLTVMQPVYGADKLAGAVFGIYAAVDTWLNDGNDGPKIYDSITGEEIHIPKTKSTHAESLWETITSALSQFFTGAGDVYETGEMTHHSGAKLWYLLDRNDAEDDHYTRVYVSPEQKDTTYQYAYQTAEGNLNYRYDVDAALSYQAGGKNQTKITLKKTTSVQEGFLADIPLTVPSGKAGGSDLNPLQNYISGITDPTVKQDFDSLTVSEKTYTYEADGAIGEGPEGTDVDFGAIGAKRYLYKEYIFYKLTKADLVEVEKVTTPAEDKDGDGVIDPTKGDVAEVKETKYQYEWDNGIELFEPVGGDGNPVKKQAGDLAVAITRDDAEPENLDKASFTVRTRGYYLNGEEVAQEAYVPCDQDGNLALSYTVPEAFTEVPFTGSAAENPHYIIAQGTEKVQTTDPVTGAVTETEQPVYKVLLDDMTTWQTCDANGNFKKLIVQVYEITFMQQPTCTEPMEVSWDGFILNAIVDQAAKTATTTITKQDGGISPIIDVGAGYTYDLSGNTATFTTTMPKAPIYFMSKDGIKTEMYYAGGAMQFTLTIPQSAVDKDYEHIVPTLKFIEGTDITAIDWYSKLTPDHPVTKGEPKSGISWIATRHESGKVGEAEYYTLEITSKLTKDFPMEITFADGYTMTAFAETAESGNGVGVIVLDALYKTNRYAIGQLVETITADQNGVATSSPLPLGTYIIRELSAPENYVTDKDSYEVTLSYKDQFTPLIWQKVNIHNEQVKIELDLEKAFETAYQSGQFEKGSGAVFGLYNAEAIPYVNQKGEKLKLKADTLIDVLEVDAQGRCVQQVKVPMGLYYIKEISTRSQTHVLNDRPFYFMATDKNQSSDPWKVDDSPSGIHGQALLDAYGKATITIDTLVRYPAAAISVNGRAHSLDTAFAAEDHSYKIEVNKDHARLTLHVQDGKTANVVLANGKTLTLTVAGNTYTYSYDGNTGTYVPTITYTGYQAEYVLEKPETPVKGSKTYVLIATGWEQMVTPAAEGIDADGNGSYDDPGDTKPQEEVTESTGNILYGTSAVRFTDTYEAETEEKLVTAGQDVDGDGIINPAAGGGDIAAVYETVDKLDKDGKQVLNHYVDLWLTGDDTVLVGSKEDDPMQQQIVKFDPALASNPETAMPPVRLTAGQDFTFATTDGTLWKARMTKGGKLVVSASNNVSAKLVSEDEAGLVKNMPTLTTETGGAATEGKFTVYRSITQARQDSAANTVRIKVNTVDNLNASAIENEHKDVPMPEPGPTPTPGNGKIEITKVDMETGETLPGAEFEIWNSRTDEEGNAVPNQLIYIGVTGEDGKLELTTPYGVYYYHETKAPEGYQCDSAFYQIEVKDGAVVTRVTMFNTRKREVLGPPKKPNRPEKPEKPKKPDNHKTPIESDVPKTGDERRLGFYYFLSAAALFSLLITWQKEKRKRRKKEIDYTVQR